MVKPWWLPLSSFFFVVLHLISCVLIPPFPRRPIPFPTPLQQAPSLIEYLKQEEGFRSKPYKDSEGVLTIGYGLNLSEGITRAEAEWLLRSRLDHATYTAWKEAGSLTTGYPMRLRMRWRTWLIR